MEVIRSRASGLRRGAGTLLISLAVVAAVTGGYFGLRHVAVLGDSASGPAARAGAAMAFDPTTDDVVMFGGTSAAGQALSDTWLWDGSAWSQAAPAESPPARYGAQMAWDPHSQRMILLGGSGCSAGGVIGSGISSSATSSGAVTSSGSATFSGSVTSSGSVLSSGDACTQLQDAWTWDGSDWSQIALGHGTGQLGDYTLAGASMATDPDSGKLILVSADSPATSVVPPPGIYNSGGASSGTLPGSSPVAISGSASAATGSGGVCIGVDGGPCGSPVALPPTGAGTAPAQTACPLDGGCASTLCPAPPVAQSTIACPISCAIAMIACPICPATASPEPGPVNPAVGCPICPPTGGPEPGVATPAIACRICPATASGTTPTCGFCPATPATGTVCAICPGIPAAAGPAAGTGVVCSNCPLESPCPAPAATLTWVFDGTTFQLSKSSTSDSPASGGELAWFPGPGLLVDLGPDLGAVAGGVAVACPYDAPCPLFPATEDWQWTGSGWTPVQDLQSKVAAPYFEVPPVTDTAAGEVLGLDPTGGVWISTNPAGAWLKASPADAPTPRSQPALADDPATGQVVLFGGEVLGSTSAAGDVVGDTWTWDGTTWTEREGSAPTPTSSATLVPTALGVPSLPPVPSTSPVTSLSPAPKASVSATATATVTAPASPAANSLPAIAPTTG
jgi:hypothetical protein